MGRWHPDYRPDHQGTRADTSAPQCWQMCGAQMEVKGPPQ